MKKGVLSHAAVTEKEQEGEGNDDILIVHFPTTKTKHDKSPVFR